MRPSSTSSDAPPEIQETRIATTSSDPAAAPGTLKALKAQAERQIVLAALEKHGWQVTRTAEALGLADHSSSFEDHAPPWTEQRNDTGTRDLVSGGHERRKRVSGRTRRAKSSSASSNPNPTATLGLHSVRSASSARSRVASRLR